MGQTSIADGKYSGCGNTFFLIDNREATLTHSRIAVQELCRQNADGLIVLENSDTSDYRMRIFNADGSEAEMCGNGVRCLMQFIRDLHPEVRRCTIETGAGVVVAKALDRLIEVEMPQPVNLDLNIEMDGLILHSIDTGVPHVVHFVEDIHDSQWMQRAPSIRYHSRFRPRGTNVNFAQLKGKEIWIRTYERGVEGETLACGTGATAVALVAAQLYKLPSPIHLITRSGDPLLVRFDPTFSKAALIGPAVRI